MLCRRCWPVVLALLLGVTTSPPARARINRVHHAKTAQDPLPAPAPGIDVDRLEGTVVYFKAPAGEAAPPPLKTELYDLKFLGALRSLEPGTPPYFLFSGRPCQGCLEDMGIYSLPPSGGRPAAYVFPGKILEPKSRQLLLESRSFWGRCLRGRGDVFVTFQKERIDRRHGMQASVEIAEPGAQHMVEQLVERHVPRLSDTLALVKKELCHEIEGRNRLMLTKPLNRSRRAEDELEGEEQDDTPKENQTDDDLVPDAP